MDYRQRVALLIDVTGSDGRRIRHRLDRLCDHFDENGHDGVVDFLASQCDQQQKSLDEQIAHLEQVIQSGGSPLLCSQSQN